MYLSKYLKTHDMTYSEFAKFCGLARITIYKILKGTDMYLSSAVKIVESTNWDVTFTDLEKERLELKNPGSKNGQKKNKKKTEKAKNK